MKSNNFKNRNYKTTPENVLQKFMERVDKNGPNGCWEWLGHRAGGGKKNIGYAKFIYDDEQYASRTAYKLFNGEFDRALDVLHTCDNPGCVNPNHLFLGTAKDNRKDMFDKGRGPNLKGENHPMWGKTHSEEAKKKMSESHKGLSTWNTGLHTSGKPVTFQGIQYTSMVLAREAIRIKFVEIRTWSNNLVDKAINENWTDEQFKSYRPGSNRFKGKLICS